MDINRFAPFCTGNEFIEKTTCALLLEKETVRYMEKQSKATVGTSIVIFDCFWAFIGLSWLS